MTLRCGGLIGCLLLCTTDEKNYKALFIAYSSNSLLARLSLVKTELTTIGRIGRSDIALFYGPPARECNRRQLCYQQFYLELVDYLSSTSTYLDREC